MTLAVVERRLGHVSRSESPVALAPRLLEPKGVPFKHGRALLAAINEVPLSDPTKQRLCKWISDAGQFQIPRDLCAEQRQQVGQAIRRFAYRDSPIIPKDLADFVLPLLEQGNFGWAVFALKAYGLCPKLKVVCKKDAPPMAASSAPTDLIFPRIDTSRLPTACKELFNRIMDSGADFGERIERLIDAIVTEREEICSLRGGFREPARDFLTAQADTTATDYDRLQLEFAFESLIRICEDARSRRNSGLGWFGLRNATRVECEFLHDYAKSPWLFPSVRDRTFATLRGLHKFLDSSGRYIG